MQSKTEPTGGVKGVDWRGNLTTFTIAGQVKIKRTRLTTLKICNICAFFAIAVFMPTQLASRLSPAKSGYFYHRARNAKRKGFAHIAAKSPQNQKELLARIV